MAEFEMRITRGHLVLLALILVPVGIFWMMRRYPDPQEPAQIKILVTPMVKSAPQPPVSVIPKAPSVKPAASQKSAAPVAKKKIYKTEKKRVRTSPKSKTGKKFHVVQRGECLWVISRRYYGKGKLWTEIYKANRARIKNPRRIYSGQRFQIPSV